MNKKGFTLIEVIVSLVIVSIVMAFMLPALTKIRTVYDDVHTTDDIELYRSTITRIINNDINKNGGINSITISKDTMSCDIILGNEKTRKIEIYDNVSEIDNEETKTLKYLDENDELIYIKTLSLIKHNSSSDGYTFAGLLKDNVTVNEKNLTLLTIRIYNGLNYEDRTNDIVISSVN